MAKRAATFVASRFGAVSRPVLVTAVCEEAGEGGIWCPDLLILQI